MTAEPIAPPEAPAIVPQRIQARPTNRDPNLDSFVFCWDYWIPNPADPDNPDPGYDDTPLTAVRPKQAVLLAALQTLAALEDRPEGEEVDLSAVQSLYDFLGKMLIPESVAYVRERLEDPEDLRDIDPDLTALVTTLIGKWHGGPAPKADGPGKPVSQRPRSTTGRRSTAASRSKGSTRKR